MRILCVCAALTSSLSAAERHFEEIRKIPATEAHQGVAVDEQHIYAIANRAIGKYDKVTGQLTKRWEATDDIPLIHLNAGIVLGDRLYCAHSNSPGLPMTSSIEIWNTADLTHVDTHSFGIYEGSLTWIDRHDGYWWAVFAQYSRPGLTDGQQGTHATLLVQFDDNWQRRQSWVFPKKIIERFEPYSNSGGAWGPDRMLYCSGHDRRELYVLRLPKAGSVLNFVETVSSPAPGQAFAWDHSQPGTLFAINRKMKQVIEIKLTDFVNPPE